MLAVTLSAQILIFPIMIMNFNTVSFSFFLSNILAMPVLGVIIILGYVNIFLSFVLFDFAKFISMFLKSFIYILNLISQICARLPLSNITVITPHYITIIVYYIIVIGVFFAYKNNLLDKIKKHSKIITAIIISFVLILGISYIIPKNLRIYFIDVGQGDSTLVISPEGKKILIDGGEAEQKIIVEYLLDRKIQKLDYVCISHLDSDHCGGIFEVLEKLTVENVIIGKQSENCENLEKLLSIASKKKINVISVEQGDLIEIPETDIFLEIIFPSSKNVIKNNAINNNSLVFRLIYREFKMLFTGDIEKEAENIILEQSSENLEVDIIKVAHHGSSTSSIQTFLDKVNPQIAVIGVRKKQ